MSLTHVLAVEDSPAQAELVVADLRDAGFAVTLAPDGEQALALLEGGAFDLVLSDVVMPGIDGYELCRRIKDRRHDLPVILMTSLDDPMEIVHALSAGADNFLRKPYDPEQLLSRVQAMLRPRPPEARGPGGAGLEVVVRDRSVVVTAERQQILHLLISSFEDLVSSNKALHAREVALRATEEKLRWQLAATERERRRISTILGAAPQAMVIVDPDGAITDVSDDLCRLLDTPRALLVGRRLDDEVRFADASGRALAEAARPFVLALRADAPVEHGTSFDLYLEGPDRAQVAVIARTAPVHDDQGRVIAVVGAIQEIGALSSHDGVTKLPNQGWFAGRVGTAAAAASAADDRWVAVVAISLDRFARLRESLSPAALDELLAAVADRLRDAIADHGLAGGVASAAYFGHDMFAVVVPDLDDELDGRRVAQQLSTRLGGEPVLVGDLELTVALTIGVAVDDGSTDDPVRLVSAAVGAARRTSAAGAGGRVVMADPAADARADDWLRRQAELRAAIDDGQLVVHYHPVMDLRTGGAVGLEALVRWQHPERGLLPPAEFLPLAVETGLIGPLSWFVLEQAGRQAARWRAAATSEATAPTLSVNIDGQQLADPGIAAHVAAILEATGLDPRALVLEVTERGVTEDPVQAAERLRELKALGVRVAIDDFGTGYSSLVQLRRFPVDVIKIDPSFVRGMTTEAADAAIVAATARLARALGIDAVAEGVETEEQLVQLRLLGCDLGQGFHWTQPMPAEEVESWLAQQADGAVGPEADGDDTDEGYAAFDEVVAYLVHELRSPLAVISGFAALAVETRPEDEALLAPIVRSALDMDRRIAMLADIRAAGQGAMTLELLAVDLGGAVRTLVSDLTPQLLPHVVSVAAEGSLTVRVDTSRLAQAVTNLLVNAAKFSAPDAPIDVVVTRSGRHAAIAVRDHGIGVPEERRPELFRRFARLGSRAQGTGVGLHLVRAIARAHGGDVQYAPASGAGSCFTITLPLEA